MAEDVVELRSARVEDAESIRRIYNHEVTTGTNVFDIEPRSLATQRAWLTERSGVHAVLVAVVDEEVVGFASLSRYKERPCYASSVEDSVYVAAQCHGQGIGGALLGEIIRVANDHGFHTMIARITASNDASVALHRRHGFTEVGIEREIGRKFGKWLDVVEMQLLL